MNGIPPPKEPSTPSTSFSHLPILDLSHAFNPDLRPALLSQLHSALFHIGFLYLVNHGVPTSTINALTSKLPALFALPPEVKASLSKINNPHFLGYSGFAEETTLGHKDLREQFDFATELPVVWREDGKTEGNGRKGSVNGQGERDFSNLYWRLRGPNQWPPEDLIPGFQKAYIDYNNALSTLSYSFVHLVEEAFNIPIGTFDTFFQSLSPDSSPATFLEPQHRTKLIKYPPTSSLSSQGVGAHKDSSGWLTFLYQVGKEEGLEVVNSDGEWIPAPPVENSFVVNFGHAFEAATEGAVRATVHRVKAPTSTSQPRYSIPFFQGLPLDLTLSQVRSYMPESVRSLRRGREGKGRGGVASFLDARWDGLGESQLRKWIRSHEDVGRKWYGDEVVEFYLR
ncbi:MAG: Clavaminate synthase [Lasallia pustulata]|uniref:Clavaminate synthase n=1 Tax=Lasallia pustulata TaxID=136370 RepID=A0A5M8Q004_9LECA|nr:MAG: Clavaminate synthase [Lasallia pustulata]